MEKLSQDILSCSKTVKFVVSLRRLDPKFAMGSSEVMRLGIASLEWLPYTHMTRTYSTFADIRPLGDSIVVKCDK